MAPNGAGKTTLLETLIGERPPARGRVTVGHRVSPAYFSQHGEDLDDARTVVETVLIGSDLTQTQARTLLGGFLFSGEAADVRVDRLSGGERRRLSLVSLIAKGGNLLVLDEPTNHLDTESREALEEALDAFDGTVVLVSHDRALIDTVATHTLALEQGAAVMRAGGYGDLVRVRAEAEAARAGAPARAAPAARAAAARAPAGAAARRAPAAAAQGRGAAPGGRDRPRGGRHRGGGGGPRGPRRAGRPGRRRGPGRGAPRPPGGTRVAHAGVGAGGGGGGGLPATAVTVPTTADTRAIAAPVSARLRPTSIWKPSKMTAVVVA